MTEPAACPSPPAQYRRFVLLDRDGVINRERGDFTTTVEEWEWVPGALAGMKKLTKAGFGIIVITNQSGISRGIITEDGLANLHDFMIRTVRDAGGDIARVYHCPHKTADNCSCRKPHPTMLLAAANDFGFDLAGTFFIGDAPRDMEAAARAGAQGVFIDTTPAVTTGATDEPVPFAFRAKNLLEAADIVIRETPPGV